jgi:hypothetical protein
MVIGKPHQLNLKDGRYFRQSGDSRRLFGQLLTLNMLFSGRINIEFRIMNVECRRDEFRLFYKKNTERSDSIICHSSFVNLHSDGFPNALIEPDPGKRRPDRQNRCRQFLRFNIDINLMVHRVPGLDNDGTLSQWD